MTACTLMAAILALTALGMPMVAPASAATVDPPPTLNARTGPIELSFGDIHQRPVGARGLKLSDAVRDADGHTVRLVGYVVTQEEPELDRFYFSPVPLLMSEHADGEADDLPGSTLLVLLPQSGAEHPPAGQRIALVGILQVGRQEDINGRVSWLRLQLPPAPSPAVPAGASEPSDREPRLKRTADPAAPAVPAFNKPTPSLSLQRTAP